MGTIVKGETYIKGWYIGIKGGYNSEGSSRVGTI